MPMRPSSRVLSTLLIKLRAAMSKPCWACPLGSDKQLRHSLPFAGIALYSKSLFVQDARRLVKRRQALQECNLPRNSQLETHRDDEAGSGPLGAAPAMERKRCLSYDRFPHA